MNKECNFSLLGEICYVQTDSKEMYELIIALTHAHTQKQSERNR